MVTKNEKTVPSPPASDKTWVVEFYDDFASEFKSWSPVIQDPILESLIRLRQFGPSLGRPSVDTLNGSEFANMKELRVDAVDGV